MSRILRRAARWLAGPVDRPSWQLDIKWLCGLLCLVAVLAAAVLYSASRLTERDPATATVGGVMAAFVKEGDGAEGFDEVQAQAAAHPDEQFTIEGVTLPLTGSEIANRTYEETVDLVVGRLAETLYDEGPQAVEQYFQDPPEEGAAADGGGEGSDLGPASLLTASTHDTLSRISRLALIPVAVLILPLTFFSRRFGRLGSPGLVVALGTAPVTLAWTLARLATRRSDGEGLDGAVGSALAPTAADVSGDFLRITLVGAALIVVAVLGHAGFGLWRRLRSGPAPAPAPAAEAPPAPPPAEEQAAGDEDRFPYIGPGGVPQA